ncbi:GntR family transcriptional regulator [Anaerobacillus alkalidiazotrophicus]|uniref:GntR family transcriptional regulator n=2 Tax=Anaerobacillus TaxID=704093 RepID=A0A1S2M305_9BACI|nr:MULTISPECIES: GntR family transcriptional regulator [Anaerobacillus]OIJ11170.1 GntR family transcriptional regulator [Anaerobacillus alkalilacustris]OIJ18966.1 GntR family transcriptional regulator [Anaerobacillus alkalidiazotrophicus]
MNVSFDNSKPIYLQLMDYFFQQICNGSIEPGEKLPSVRETAVEVGVNPNTVQRTYAEMERLQVVVAKRGQGSFVTEDKTIIKRLRSEISEQYVGKFVTYMKNNGFTEEEIIEQVSVALKKSL